jgi:PLP dependent protein
MDITERIKSVRDRIGIAAKKSERSEADIKLIAVTKYVDQNIMKIAISEGIDAIGENRADSIEKFEGLRGVEKHFIGTLQSNKVKLVVKHFDCIHSVDSFKLGKAIDEEAMRQSKTMPILIEVNIGDEETKHGVSAQDAMQLCNNLTRLTHVRVIGLMCIAPYVPCEYTRPYFRKMKELKDLLGLKELSMGMSNDFEIAIEQGSTMVRIGREIFGEH